jgi:hypothetical protein
MSTWREPPDVRSADGKYHLKEFCAWENQYIQMPTRTFWTAEQINALFPQGVPVDRKE